MKKLLKQIIDTYHFNSKLNFLISNIPKNKTYKIQITKDQLGILEYCAIIGIDNFKQISDLPCMKKFNKIQLKLPEE